VGSKCEAFLVTTLMPCTSLAAIRGSIAVDNESHPVKSSTDEAFLPRLQAR
jgi:hypothetical protein